MSATFREDPMSQLPAVELLVNLGWEYLTPGQALVLRGGRRRAVVLEEVLRSRLRDINSRSDRKTLAITVHPDLRVEAIAPLAADDSAILARVQARARWILRQRRQFLSWMPPPWPERSASHQLRRGRTVDRLKLHADACVLHELPL